MQVRDIMTPMQVCCLPDYSLRRAAQTMLEHDCRAITVVDNKHSKRLLGIMTDRDIVSRAIAHGKNPLLTVVRDCMSSPVVTVTPEDSLETCRQLMAENRIRRIPVVDAEGAFCGMVTQAHLMRHATASPWDPFSGRADRRVGTQVTGG